MAHYEFTLKTKDDLNLFGQTWHPEADPKAVVCLIHGLGEHSGRYTHVAEVLNMAGYALTAVDLRGHGKSEGKRGYIPYYDIMLDDVDLLLKTSAERFPVKPLFLYGHSLGGNLVLDYAIKYQPKINGIIDSAGILRTATPPPVWKVLLGRTMNRIWPSFIMANGIERKALSRDPAVVQAYCTDPLVHDRLSARLGISFLESGERLLQNASQFPKIPLLIMHGLDDRLTSPIASQQFAAGVIGDVVFKPWDKLYHEIHNEPEKQLVLNFTIDWMNAHL